MDVLKAKEQVVQAGIEISQSGLIARTWGNVSVRTGADEFAITASGRNYMTLTPDEVIQIKIKNYLSGFLYRRVIFCCSCQNSSNRLKLSSSLS